MLRWLVRIGVSRGLLGGSRGWTVVGGVALAVRAVKKIGGSEPKVVYTASLRPGEALLVCHDRNTRVLRPPL
jgi:hypothetical protein